MVSFDMLGTCMVSYECAVVSLSPRRAVFLDIRLISYNYNTVTLKPGLGVT